MNTLSFTFTLPKQTTTPMLKIIEVWGKNLNALSVQIPPGHKGLTGLSISIPSAKIAPAPGSSDLYITGDDQTINYEPNLEIPGPPYNIILYGINNDIFLDHSFYLRVTTE